MNKTKEADIWFQKAKDDLLWTKANIKEKIYYGACFTAQQAVEKALKAYLINEKGSFEKSHDLVKILDACVKYNKNLRVFRSKIAKLSFYYLETRYPDITEIDSFDLQEAQSALSIAEEIIDYIEKELDFALIKNSARKHNLSEKQAYKLIDKVRHELPMNQKEDIIDLAGSYKPKKKKSLTKARQQFEKHFPRKPI